MFLFLIQLFLPSRHSFAISKKTNRIFWVSTAILLTKYTVMKLIRYCRENNIIALLGGPDASTQVEEFLNYGADIIVSGEGEEALLAVLQTLERQSKNELHNIPNISFKDINGSIIQNQRQASRKQLDEYPHPDREAIDLHQYLDTWEKHHGQRSVSLITARGCAFTCKWCSHSVYGFTHWRRKPEKWWWKSKRLSPNTAQRICGMQMMCSRETNAGHQISSVTLRGDHSSSIRMHRPCR